MEPVLVLDEPALQVEPGAEVRTTVTITGGGSDVERYRLDVVGDVAKWAHVAPRHVSVQPGAEQVAEVVFRPPHAVAAAPRLVPFGVRASSPDHRDRAAIVEGDLLVTPVPGIAARIEPSAAAGRRGAGYVVHLANSGPRPASVRVAGTGGAGALRFAVAPHTTPVPAGGTADAYVAVRPRRPRLLGRPRRREFGVEYRIDGAGGPGRLPAVFEQHPVLPTAVGVLLALVGVAAVTGAVLLLVPPRPATAPPGGVATAPPEPPAAAAAPPTAAATTPVHGFVVIYGPPTPVDDTVNARAAEQLARRLQAAGVPARLVDSRDSDQLDDGLSGLLVVLQDGFPDRTAAAAECAARREVAPSCVVVAPR